MKISMWFFFILITLMFAFSLSGNAVAQDLGFMPTKKFSNVELEKINIDTDWDELPVITTREEFYEYLNNCFEERMTVFPIVFGKKFKINANTGKAFNDSYLPMYVHEWRFQIIVDKNNNDIIKAVYQVVYYPGLHIADAYFNNDTSNLTDDELKVYKIALSIVEKAKQYSDDLDKELYIFNMINRRAKFKYIDFSKGVTHIKPRSALGIFLDGIGNCAAFTDAFYMLGTMAGLEVGVILGNYLNGGHTWNTIVIDGCAYFVDLSLCSFTFTHKNNKYLHHYWYFNSPREVMLPTHNWYNAYESEPIEDEIDENYFYCTDLHYKNNRGKFGIYKESPEEVLDSVADGIVKNRWTLWYAMTSYNEYYTNGDNVYRYLAQELRRRNWSGNSKINIKVYGNKNLKYMYYTISLD